MVADQLRHFRVGVFFERTTRRVVANLLAHLRGRIAQFTDLAQNADDLPATGETDRLRRGFDADQAAALEAVMVLFPRRALG